MRIDSIKDYNMSLNQNIEIDDKEAQEMIDSFFEAYPRLEKFMQQRNNISCPHCGTTEMLCGHNGVGCTSES